MATMRTAQKLTSDQQLLATIPLSESLRQHALNQEGLLIAVSLKQSIKVEKPTPEESTLADEGLPLEQEIADAEEGTALLDKIQKSATHNIVLLEQEIQQTAAYHVLFGDLQEYAANSLDAGATELQLFGSITEEAVTFTLKDNGKGVAATDDDLYPQLIKKSAVSYDEFMESKTHFKSKKTGQADKIGGAGTALLRGNEFLKQYKGNITLRALKNQEHKEGENIRIAVEISSNKQPVDALLSYDIFSAHFGKRSFSAASGSRSSTPDKSRAETAAPLLSRKNLGMTMLHEGVEEEGVTDSSLIQAISPSVTPIASPGTSPNVADLVRRRIPPKSPSSRSPGSFSPQYLSPPLSIRRLDASGSPSLVSSATSSPLGFLELPSSAYRRLGQPSGVKTSQKPSSP